MSYTQAEKDVLVAGLVGGYERDAVWSGLPEAVRTLARLGMVRLGQEMLPDGTVSSFPLCLSPTGVVEARALHDVTHTLWGEIAQLAGFGNIRA
ncbi:MAG TPA: hypothetical protein VII76_05210 [Acidimicrobiales bacterium]